MYYNSELGCGNCEFCTVIFVGKEDLARHVLACGADPGYDDLDPESPSEGSCACFKPLSKARMESRKKIKEYFDSLEEILKEEKELRDE